MKTRFTLLCLLGIASSCNLDARQRLDEPIHSLVASGVDLILKQDYKDADSIFTIVAEKFPAHPAGPLYRAAVMQAYAIDFSIPVDREKFDSLLAQGRERAAGLNSPWREYFLGTADGYEAYACADDGDWMGAVKHGMSSADEFETLIKRDSSFYDAYVGIGTYYYWSARKTSFLRWLPFVPDHRKLGIEMLVAAANRSEYNRYAAMSALVSVFLDAEQYDQAEAWSVRGLKSYPENRIFLWGLATALDREHHPDTAVHAYERLLQNLIRSNAPHPYDKIVCTLNLAKTDLAIQDTASALEQLEQIHSYENAVFPPALQTRAQAKFEDARGLQSRLEKNRSRSR